MKTKVTYNLICVLFVLSLMPQVQAQNTEKKDIRNKDQGKETIDISRKQQREALNMADFEKAKAALESGNWILEADRIYPENGSPIRVSEQDNFVSLENNTSLVKLSHNMFYGEYHKKYLGSYIKTLGSGITLKGTPTKIQMKEDKFRNVIYQMNLIGTAMTANLILTLYNESMRAEVAITSIGTDAKFKLVGNLIPIDESSAYKGGTNL